TAANPLPTRTTAGSSQVSAWSILLSEPPQEIEDDASRTPFEFAPRDDERRRLRERLCHRRLGPGRLADRDPRPDRCSAREPGDEPVDGRLHTPRGRVTLVPAAVAPGTTHEEIGSGMRRPPRGNRGGSAPLDHLRNRAASGPSNPSFTSPCFAGPLPN